MKTDKVWATTIIGSHYSIRLNIFDTATGNPVVRAMLKGQEPQIEDLPLVLFPQTKDADIRNVPELFVDAGHLVFSEKVAAVLRQFNLGRTYMAPVKIVLSDRETEVYADRAYVTMNRYTAVDAFGPENSRNVRANTGPNAIPNRWRLERDIEDYDIALSLAALQAAPIWAASSLPGVKFLRGDVVEALETASVAHHWRPKRCRIIG